MATNKLAAFMGKESAKKDKAEQKVKKGNPKLFAKGEAMEGEPAPFKRGGKAMKRGGKC